MSFNLWLKFFCGRLFFPSAFRTPPYALHQRPKKDVIPYENNKKKILRSFAPRRENHAVVTVGSGCVWTLTGDFTVTSLVNNGTIIFNGCTITLADGTVMQ